MDAKNRNFIERAESGGLGDKCPPPE